jgi:hypothetical protein
MAREPTGGIAPQLRLAFGTPSAAHAAHCARPAQQRPRHAQRVRRKPLLTRAREAAMRP